MREKQLTQIFEKFVGEIYRYVYSFTFNKEATEDIVGETFKRMLEKSDIDENLVKFWLLTVARNLTMDYLKKQNKLVSDEEALFSQDSGQDSEADALQQNLSAYLKKKLEELNPVYREVITLRAWGDMSFTQIAEIVGTTEDALPSRRGGIRGKS